MVPSAVMRPSSSVVWHRKLSSASTAMPDVFAVTFKCELAGGATTPAERHEEKFSVLRPTWVLDAGEQTKLRAEVRRRIDETGTSEPSIQKQGTDRIIVELPGLDDPTRVKALLGQTAKMNFHMVEPNVTSTNPRDLPPGTMLLEGSGDAAGRKPYLSRCYRHGNRCCGVARGYQLRVGIDSG